MALQNKDNGDYDDEDEDEDLSLRFASPSLKTARHAPSSLSSTGSNGSNGNSNLPAVSFASRTRSPSPAVINQKMEGKTVILSVLIMNLVMAQIQVDAKNLVAMHTCCPNKISLINYRDCRLAGGSQQFCKGSGVCIIIHAKCPPSYLPYLENSGDAVNEYCKLGCASSVCGAMEALQNFDGSEIVNGAVEQCAKACSTFCTKGSTAGVGTA